MRRVLNGTRVVSVYGLRRILRRFGFELRRFDPDAYLGVFATTVIAEFGLNCVVDVGANVGQFGTMLRNDGYEGEILSFEPVQEAFDQLVQATAADGRWRAVRAALGAADGELSINILGNTQMSSLLRPADAAADRWNVEMDVLRLETVPVRRLDEVLADLAPVVDTLKMYLKIDVQGTDLDVIKGADGILENVAAIQTELSFKPLYDGQITQDETLRYLGELGYELAGLFPVAHDHNYAIVEADAVLVHRDLTRP